MKTGVLSRIFEGSLNVVSLLAAAYLVIFVVQSFAGKDSPPPSVKSRADLKGQSLTAVLPSVHWADAPLSVVLFTKTSCPWCQESVPFHRQIVKLAESEGIPVLAVADEPLPTLKTVLLAQGLEVSSAHSAAVGSIGIVGTPTIAIVDSKGNIQRVWQGFVAADRQIDVLNALSPEAKVDAIHAQEAQPALLDVPTVPNVEIANYMAPSPTRVVLDIRDRDKFSEGHIRGAINIPADEIQMRAAKELPPHFDVAVFCDYQAGCEGEHRANGTPTICTVSTLVLRSVGINARILPASLSSLHSAPVQFAQRPIRPGNGRRQDLVKEVRYAN